MTDLLDRARDFVDRNARLLERRRFSFLFDGGPAQAVVAALDGYRNPDGGYGNALEPDLRGPESEPVPTWTALWLMDEVGQLDRRTSRGILRYLSRVEAAGGGVPFVFPAARRHPHAPWWEVGPRRPRGSLNPTAGIAAALYKNGIRSSWLERATAWCWDQVDRLRRVRPYELRVTLSFLDFVPDRRRAQQALERLRPLIRQKEVVELDVNAEGEVFRPLDYAPEPDRLSRTLFTDEEVGAQLDALERRQESDGGWGVPYLIWTPITQFEWRGIQTVEALKVLKANGRLDAGRPRNAVRSERRSAGERSRDGRHE